MRWVAAAALTKRWSLLHMRIPEHPPMHTYPQSVTHQAAWATISQTHTGTGPSLTLSQHAPAHPCVSLAFDGPVSRPRGKGGSRHSDHKAGFGEVGQAGRGAETGSASPRQTTNHTRGGSHNGWETHRSDCTIAANKQRVVNGGRAFVTGWGSLSAADGV